MEHYGYVARWIVAILGACLGAIEPTLPLIYLCTAAVLGDCLTAWRLSKRVKERYPERVKDHKAGRFLSSHFGRVIVTLIKAYALIIFSYFVTLHITDGIVDLAKVSAGAICFWQLLSILENESSCSEAKWAKLARHLLIDKTERHFDLDLSKLKEDGSL